MALKDRVDALDEGYQKTRKFADRALPDEAGQVLSRVDQVARHARGIAGAAAETIDALRDHFLANEVKFRFRCARHSEVEWQVRSLLLTEALNVPYEAKLEISVEQDQAPNLRSLLGSDATLEVEREPALRAIRGIVDEVELGSKSGSFVSAHLRIVPAFALLGHSQDSRVFVDRSVPDIVKTVLEQSLGLYQRAVELRELGEGYPVREVTVQYRESNLQFVSRLLEEEGFGYFFEHSEEREKLVIVDGNHAFPKLDTIDGGDLPLLAQGGDLGDIEPVRSFEECALLGVNKLVMRGRNWTAPSASIKGEQPQGEQQPGEHGAGAEHRVGPEREAYRFDDGLHYTDYDEQSLTYSQHDAERKAQLRWQETEQRQRHYRGKSLVTAMKPGSSFTLKDHPSAELNGQYLVTRVHHAGTPETKITARERLRRGLDASLEGYFGSYQPASFLFLENEPAEDDRYVNRFECIRLDTPFRPACVTPRPVARGVQLGRVVGPEGEEIWTDEHGRIMVEFDWERAGHSDRRSICPVRVSQGTAGNAFGHFFLPRIGMEVVVTFVDGNPDQPLVTGAVYNGESRPPYSLPDEKTKQGLRTHSHGHDDTMHGNELTFDDAAAAECITLHARKDLRTTVEDGETHTVKGARTITVHGFEQQIAEDQQKIRVDKDQKVEVGGSRRLEVVDEAVLAAAGGRREEIKKGRTISVLSGESSHVVNSGNWTMETKENGVFIKAKTDLTMSADNGQSSIKLEGSAGEIEVLGSSLSLRSPFGITLECGGAQVTLGPSCLELSVGGSKVTLDAAGVAIAGSQVKLNS